MWGHYHDRSKDVTRAVHLLRKHGVPEGLPMETATGQMIFAVGKELTLTADQILELLDRGELYAEDVLKLVSGANRTRTLSI